jgi:hypothetical protein
MDLSFRTTMFGEFVGQSSRQQRDYLCAPCAFNKVLPHI